MPRGARVLVALSGGSDSVALLHLLLELERQGDLSVAGAAHLNHQLRGATSDADAAFCQALAESLNIRFVLEAVDVAAAAKQTHESIEQCGRRLRYDFLNRAAAALVADRTAVAHTRDDQAETYLLRLLRGAGPDGLAGIRPRAGNVVRPLIDIEREELRRYLAEHHLEFREDATNLDVAIARNRVRHELLPLLKTRFAPGIVQALSREAEIAREDAEYFADLVRSSEPRVITRGREGVAVNIAALRAYPLPVARRIVRAAMAQSAPNHFIGFDAVDAVLELTDKLGDTRQIDGPGQRAERCGEMIVLRSRRGRTGRGDAPQTAPFSYPLEVPGQVVLQEAACRISAELAAGQSVAGDLTSTSTRVLVAAAALEAPLTVRNRHRGDIFRPLGLKGRKKLQDFFVDRKVRRQERDLIPIVVDNRNRIVWVVGHAVGQEFRVTDPAKPVVILRMTELGGEG